MEEPLESYRFDLDVAMDEFTSPKNMSSEEMPNFVRRGPRPRAYMATQGD